MSLENVQKVRKMDGIIFTAATNHDFDIDTSLDYSSTFQLNHLLIADTLTKKTTLLYMDSPFQSDTQLNICEKNMWCRKSLYTYIQYI